MVRIPFFACAEPSFARRHKSQFRSCGVPLFFPYAVNSQRANLPRHKALSARPAEESTSDIIILTNLPFRFDFS